MTNFDKIFEKLLNLIVLLGASMLTVPISLMLFTYESTVIFDGAYTIMPIFAVASTFLGYFVQWLFSKLMGKRASSDGYADQGAGIVSGFSIGHAIIPIIIFVLAAVIMFAPADSYLENMYLSGHMEYYSPVYGIFVSALFLVASVLGCVIWFYPIERLTSMTVLITAGVLFYAEVFFATLLVAPLFSMGLSVLNSSTVTNIIGLPFVIFSICLLIVFNQNNLQKKFRGSVVAVITPSARMYNLFLVFCILLILVVMCFLVYVILSGLYIIGYSIIFLIAYRTFYNQQAQENEYFDAEYFASEEGAALIKNNAMSPDSQYLLAMFILLILTAVALFILARTGHLKKIVERVRAWFRDLIYSFMIGRDIFRNATDKTPTEELYNYKDEKKRLQNAAVKDFDELANQTDNYRAFMSRLSRLKSYDEQLCYAYAVLLKMYKKINISLKTSDTPREVEDKVRRSVTEQEISRITNDFERIRYAEEQVSDSEASAILTNICDVVKRYMY